MDLHVAQKTRTSRFYVSDGKITKNNTVQQNEQSFLSFKRKYVIVINLNVLNFNLSLKILLSLIIWRKGIKNLPHNFNQSVQDMTTSWPMADIRLYINHQFQAYCWPSWTSVRSQTFSRSSKKIINVVFQRKWWVTQHFFVRCTYKYIKITQL